MKIAILSPLWKKTPPEKYGGTELVVANLAQGLTSLGHETFSFVCGGSRVAGGRVEVIEDEMYELAGGFSWGAIQAYEFLSFYELGKRIGEFDIVHNHMGFHPLALAPFSDKPFVTTLHSSVAPDFPYLAERFARENYVSISDAQRALCPGLNYVSTVYHGIDVDSFKYSEVFGDYLFFIGSLTYNKGIDIAVRAAKSSGLPLVIAGEIRDSEKDFLEREVYPYLDGKLVRFVGEVGHEEKARLYSGARALLFPSRWNEAFGLVIAEAMACGTPVIALDNGSPRELIRDGKTGFVCKDEDGFTAAISRIGSISRAECRAEAENRFSLRRMAADYVEVYKNLIGKE